MNILMLGGTWDKNGGKPSHLFEKMYNSLIKYKFKSDRIDYYNGGDYDKLVKYIETVGKYEVVFWLANVPNDLPKVRNIKKINPFTLLIGSKRNIDNEYSFVEVLNRTLEQRHNLSIMFSKAKDDKQYSMLLFDPLGTSWYDGTDCDELMKSLMERVRFLLHTTRKQTFQAEGSKDIPEQNDFLEYVHEVAEIFHKTIQHSDGVTRFLGNASFRVPNEENNLIYVSERDVDKSKIDFDHFVATYTDFSDKTFYYGDKKPSKDAVVQTHLYRMFPKINYIVHSHCYVVDGAWTQTPVPCGSLEEVTEIIKAMVDYSENYEGTFYKFNLKGHGCLIMAGTVEELKQAEYITRNLPEKLPMVTRMQNPMLCNYLYNVIVREAEATRRNLSLKIVGYRDGKYTTANEYKFTPQEFVEDDIGFIYEVYSSLCTEAPPYQGFSLGMFLTDYLMARNFSEKEKMLEGLASGYQRFLRALMLTFKFYPSIHEHSVDGIVDVSLDII